MSLPFKPASTPWLLAHELRLGWRGFMAGRKRGAVGSIIAFSVLGVMTLIGGVFLGLGMRGHEIPIGPLSIAIATSANSRCSRLDRSASRQSCSSK